MIRDIVFYVFAAALLIQTIFLAIHVLGQKFGEKKSLYVSMAALNYLLGSSWVLALYNEPSMLKMKEPSEWGVIVFFTGLFTLQSALIAWKSYTSNPSVADGDTKPTPNETIPAPTVPPASPSPATGGS